jgi:prepilin-type N-terminal cleavage/methylation domain-containing protein
MNVHARRRAQRGFTLIEVMVSLGIMMIGAMAVIGLQTQTIRANSHARQITTATQIAQIWTERLRQDACLWTQRASLAPVAPEVLAAVALGNTVYLRGILAQRGAWISPANTAPTDALPVSRTFDFQGNDTNSAPGPTDPAPFYCAAYRLNWVYFGSAMRADVRVWWPRASSSANLELDFPGCGGNLTTLDPGGTANANYHAVYVSTVIGVTQLRR